MNPIAKALWHIETQPAEELTLEAIAAGAGVSRFYLSRAFTEVMGRPLIAYARARRLSIAAQALASGAGDILSLALETGYGSHEAFTRAFRNLFGVTPEEVREARTISTLRLVEPIQMDQTQTSPLKAPRFVDGDIMLFAGFSERFHCEAKRGISGVWMRFGPNIGHVPGQKAPDAYGVVTNHDDAGSFDYIAAVEVNGFDDVPPEFARLRVAAHRYAVFQYEGHVAAISSAFAWIWGAWMASSGHAPADAPVIEHYSPAFNPMTGMGGIEIWIPIKA